MHFYYFCFVILLLLLYSLLVYYTHAPSILFLFELIWITLFSLFLFLAFYRDNLYILSFIFFILVFSSAEISIGFVLFSTLQASGTSLECFRIKNYTKFFKSTFNKIN